MANYKNSDGSEAGTEKVNVQFFAVEGEKPLAAPQYDAKVVKAGESQKAPVDTGNDQTATKPSRYSIPEGTTYTDNKGNTWTVTIDEKTGEVTATAPKAAEGETLNLDGAILNVPVTAHYKDDNGNETTRNTAVQFIGSGTEGTHEYTEELPFETTVEVNKDLAPGEWRYKVVDGKEQKGEVGSRTTKWTIKDSKIQENPEVAEKAPVNAIIEIGDKAFTGPVTHEVTEEIPFDVKIVEDETMAPGTSRVETEGVAGSKTTKYTQNIKDGKPDGELQAEEVTDKKVEPVTQVIHVGKKPTSNTDNKSSEIPVEIEYVYDNTKEDGYVAKGELIPGKVETKVENKYNPETGEIETTTTTPVVTPAKQKIIVGTKDYTGDFTHTETAEVPFETEIVFDDSLKAGEQKVTQEGKPGEKTREVTQSITNGTLGEKTVGEFKQTKDPVKQIIKVGSMTDGTVEHTEEIPFDYTVNEVDTLKKGEYEVVTPGTVGTKTTKWNIENSKVVGDPTVETTDPVNAVINVGKGTNDGTHEIVEKEVVPFETVVEFDDTLAPGEQKVTQEGVNGEKQRTTTLTIQDGNVTNTETGEYTQTQAPTNKIIKVGRNTDGTHTYTNKKPFYVEVRVNPNLPKGEHKVIQEGVEGEEEVTVTIENSKVTKTSEPKETKAPVNEIIEVGSEDYTGTFETKKTSPVEFETEYVVDNSLEPGTTKVEQEGSLGEETTTVTHKIENGKVVESIEGETTQTKAPTKRIVKVGPAKTDGTHTYTNKKPFDVEVRVNPNLAKGEYNVIQEGVEGEEEITVTIENSKVTKTSKPKETKAPVNEIIEVGSEDYTGEVTHTEHFEIPFEVEVRYNDQLPAGTSKEIQKGEKGSYDVEYKQAIKNGEADGEMTKTETNKVEAKKHIIEVGTKVETPENNYSKDVEVEIEYVYDDTKDKGVVETGELTPGKVETKVVDKYNPETGKIEQTTEEVVTKAKQKVIVGTNDFTGTYEYEDTCPVPFEVEIKEDPTLAKGERVVDQEGAPGSKTTKYEQDIENGKAVGERRVVEEKITTEPKKHIVRVGTKPAEGSTEKVVEREIPYETKVIYDETLEAGSQKIENEGKPGKEKVTITTKITDGNGETSETTETITEKEDRIVRIGTKPVTKETELPNDTEFRYNPDLKAGETKVIEEGSKGSVKYTTKFNKETGKLEVTEERTEPTNKVVEYGSKTEGKVTVESDIPFEVEIQEDPEMEAGKTEVVQEGELGKKETTITIENSKEVSREEKTVSEPTKKIIKVGTKNVCEIPPVDPSDPTDPTDPTDPGEETPGKPGEETPGKPGEETPGKPGEEKPEDPEKPGEEKPNEPGKPGEEKPNEPGKPNTPGTENPKDPEKPNYNGGNNNIVTNPGNKSENNKTVETKTLNNQKTQKDSSSKDSNKTANENVKTGVSGTISVASILAAASAGLFASKKKKEDE